MRFPPKGPQKDIFGRPLVTEMTNGTSSIQNETCMKLSHQLPDIYQAFFPKAFLSLDPNEVKATCDTCAMAPEKKKKGPTYQGDLKCCTFHPWLPNYSVGALLRDPSEGRAKAQAVVRQKMAKREYVLPTGVIPSVRYQVEFNARGKDDFGNREDWLCPFYVRDTGLCTLWRLRGSVCTAYHCKSVHGAKGKRFWKDFENYLSYSEMALMEEALVNLDFSPRQMSDMLGYFNRSSGTAAELKSDSLPEKKAREIWNGYFDEQEKFFGRCFEIVANLNRKQFEECMGDMGQELEERVFASMQVWD